MLLGERSEVIPQWAERWIDGPFRSGRMVAYKAGTTTRVVHDYQCDHCHRKTAGQIVAATEPFYCGGCNRLVSVE